MHRGQASIHYITNANFTEAQSREISLDKTIFDIFFHNSVNRPFSYLTEASSIQEGKRKEGKRKRKRGGRVTESALIQNVEGPASGNRTTAALSPIKLPPCNVVVFYSL